MRSPPAFQRAASSPAISVIIPTRNRPLDVQRCLESLTHVHYPDWEVLLVDQSDGAQTRRVVADFSDRIPSLSYLHQAEKGSARARNLAASLARGELIAFLDDDCTVGSDWLEHVAAVFLRRPEAQLVFGAVRAGPHDAAQSFIPIYEIRVEHVLRGRAAYLRSWGMGASMYVRPQLLRLVGPIDVQTGAGARFAGEDWDYCYRVLASGHCIVETPAILVQHHGARDLGSGAISRYIRRSAYSAGALHMKVLRCGDWLGLVFVAVELWRNFSRINLHNLVIGRRPSGLAWAAMYVRGLFGSLRFGVDRHRRLWVAPKERSWWTRFGAASRSRLATRILLSVDFCGVADVLRISSCLRAVRQTFPHAEIVLLVGATAYPAVGQSALFDRIVVSRLYEQRGSSLVRLRMKKLREWLTLVWQLGGGYDLVITFHRGTTLLHLLGWLVGRGPRIGYGGPRSRLLTKSLGWYDFDGDGVRQSTDLLRAAGIEVESPDPGPTTIDLPEHEAEARRLLQESGLNGLRRMIVLHPGSDWACQRWAADRWARLADELANRYGSEVLFTGSSGEREYIAGIQRQMRARAVSLAGMTTLAQLAALLRFARLCICVDSVIFELSQAAGVPVVVLAGPTNPHPFGRNAPAPVVVNRTSPELKQAIFHSQGLHSIEGGCLNYDCPMSQLRDISLEDVLKAVEKQWNTPLPVERGSAATGAYEVVQQVQ